MQFSGAINQAPVHNVCAGCLAAEFPTVDGGGLEVTAAALPNGCRQSRPNCTISEVTTILRIGANLHVKHDDWHTECVMNCWGESE